MNFLDFAAALAFTNAVGALEESENHYSAILTEWGRVTIGRWTHKIGGCTVMTSSPRRKLTAYCRPQVGCGGCGWRLAAVGRT
ncbi:MAG: 4a-hydroxytetrahydrobiopterin dehydratase, partial [Anaerolineales bacterium]|nr:4a-hydroxytetrahydrobiopterin dehydratase [Anaerolineales bacterium]